MKKSTTNAMSGTVKGPKDNGLPGLKREAMSPSVGGKVWSVSGNDGFKKTGAKGK